MNTSEKVARILWGLDPLLDPQHVDQVWEVYEPYLIQMTKKEWLTHLVDEGFNVARTVYDMYDDGVRKEA